MTMLPIDYTARDYAAIKQALVNRIPQHLPEWKNRSEHDFGMVLIELFAAMGDMLSFYIDRSANESSIQTAILRETVLSFAALVGYVPDDVVASTGQVTFTAQPGRTEDTVVPAGTMIFTDTVALGASPIAFTTDEELVIAIVDSTGSVGVTQGREVSDEVVGTSLAQASQTYSLFEVGVVVDTVFVDMVTGGVTTRWTKVDSLLEAGATDQVFSVMVDANDVAFIVFGDGVNGLIPPAGSTITATYRTAIGQSGNVASADSLTVMPESIDGIVSVTNAMPILGGVDRESLDSIKRNLPGSIKAVNRATTLEDYEPLAEQVAGVLHAKADAEVYTSVDLYIVPVGGGMPTTDLEERVEEFFATRSLIGTDVTVLDPSYVEVNINVSLFVLPTFYAQETEDRADDALSNFMALGNMDLGRTITVSEIYRTLHTVPGVDYVEVTLLARDDGPQTGTGPETFLVNEFPIKGTFTFVTSGGI